MQLLEERILKDGIVKPGNVLKVDSFLNHQMDIEFINELGKEFKRGSLTHRSQRFLPSRLPVSVLPVWLPSISMFRLFSQRKHRA